MYVSQPRLRRNLLGSSSSVIPAPVVDVGEALSTVGGAAAISTALAGTTISAVASGVGVLSDLASVASFAGPIGALISIAGVVASLFLKSHPLGHDYFLTIPPNGGTVIPSNETTSGLDANTAAWGAAYVQAFNQLFSQIRAQGYTITNPGIVIEIRDDGVTPVELHTNVQPMSAADQAKYNCIGCWEGDSTYNDRDSSQYEALGNPADLTTVATNLVNYFQSQGWFVPLPAVTTSSSPAPVTSAPIATPTPVVVTSTPAQPAATTPVVVTPIATTSTPSQGATPVSTDDLSQVDFGTTSIIPGTSQVDLSNLSSSLATQPIVSTPLQTVTPVTSIAPTQTVTPIAVPAQSTSSLDEIFGSVSPVMWVGLGLGALFLLMQGKKR